ncbi:MAG: glycosyltransferase family 2 protein [Terrimicrobiaceae bacterium]
MYSHVKDNMTLPLPLLEIFVVTYNRCDSLENTLKILIQLPDWISINVVDNASNDDTERMVHQYSTRIKVFRNIFNKGYGLNYLTAVELASGKYFWVVGDDDSYDFSDIDGLREVLELSDYDIVMVGDAWDGPRPYHGETSDIAKKYPTSWFNSCFVAGNILRTSTVKSLTLASVFIKAHLLYPGTHIYYLLTQANASTSMVFYKPLVRREQPKEFSYPSFTTFANWIELISCFKDKTIRISALKGYLRKSENVRLLPALLGRIVRSRLDWNLCVKFEYLRSLIYAPASIKLPLLPCFPAVYMPESFLKTLRAIYFSIRYKIFGRSIPKGFYIPKAKDPLRRI